MAPGPHPFDLLGYPSTALPVHRGPTRGSEIQPPPVHRHLKPDRKAKPTPLDLRSHAQVIDGLPSNSPVTESGSRVDHDSASPVPGGSDSLAPGKSPGRGHYILLDFQPGSESSRRGPSTPPVTSDGKLVYARVDKEKTQALQKTSQEWTAVRRDSEHSKGAAHTPDQRGSAPSWGINDAVSHSINKTRTPPGLPPLS